MRVRNTDLNIRIGISGFSYEDWIGHVYPKGIHSGEMLPYYSGKLGFDIVELNYTYYTMPTVAGVAGLLDKVPEDFEFVAKAHSSMTNKIKGDDGSYLRDEASCEVFIAGLEPMIDSGRLKCVLAQFPMKFAREEGALEHLEWFAGKMGSVRLAFELRDKSWVTQSVFDKLRGLGVSYCVVDGPEISRLPPFMPVATSPLAYFRFHGRNRKWFGVPSHVRYNYLYSDEELRQFLSPIRKVASTAEETLVFFNNHFRGAAVKNALRLRELLETT